MLPSETATSVHDMWKCVKHNLAPHLAYPQRRESRGHHEVLNTKFKHQASLTGKWGGGVITSMRGKVLGHVGPKFITFPVVGR